MSERHPDWSEPVLKFVRPVSGPVTCLHQLLLADDRTTLRCEQAALPGLVTCRYHIKHNEHFVAVWREFMYGPDR